METTLTKETVAAWLVGWFEQKGPVPGDDLQAQLEVNYFDADLIDSLGVVMLIAEIEDRYDIAFNEQHFQERRFSTIGGLSEMIIELTGESR
jgi:D-alanine--poly(phosphoribitol) ligase subunit 2